MVDLQEIRIRCDEVNDADERFGRLVASAFGEREARLSIPARPLDDDDLVVGRYLREAIKDRVALLARVEELQRQIDDLESQPRVLVVDHIETVNM